MNVTRKGAVIFGLIGGIVFAKPNDYTLFIPNGIEIALSFFGAAINILVLLGVVLVYNKLLPSLLSNEWHMPHEKIPPFNVWSEPVNFFHFCGVVFTSLGISGSLISLLFSTVPFLVTLQIILIGLGTLAGVKIVPYAFPNQVKYYSNHE
ncbi:MAG: hypothetical protein JAY84_10870 [Candidatus Thiodiazotropha taylori]|nr:hypothetical protein [Candidatus Thiodiazotropha taylori]